MYICNKLLEIHELIKNYIFNVYKKQIILKNGIIIISDYMWFSFIKSDYKYSFIINNYKNDDYRNDDDDDDDDYDDDDVMKIKLLIFYKNDYQETLSLKESKLILKILEIINSN
jgi:hypothetical protein